MIHYTIYPTSTSTCIYLQYVSIASHGISPTTTTTCDLIDRSNIPTKQATRITSFITNNTATVKGAKGDGAGGGCSSGKGGRGGGGSKVNKLGVAPNASGTVDNPVAAGNKYSYLPGNLPAKPQSTRASANQQVLPGQESLSLDALVAAPETKPGEVEKEEGEAVAQPVAQPVTTGGGGIYPSL